MPYAAKILLDSISPDGIRLTTYEVTYPRFVHAELMTHRVFSRNSASSRAIPVEKMIQKVLTDPAMPVWWGKNQKGMQAAEELTGLKRWAAEKLWVGASRLAVLMAKAMLKLDCHKQITNRLLEPWLYHTVIVTATEWSNFFGLRCHPAAQPEIRKIAEMMRDLYEQSTPKLLNYGEWHMPLLNIDEDDANALGLLYNLDGLKLISTGRCARISYLTHDGKRDHEADISLATKLIGDGHMSPPEHVARPATPEEGTGFQANFRGWHQFRLDLPHQDDFSKRGKAA